MTKAFGRTIIVVFQLVQKFIKKKWKMKIRFSVSLNADCVGWKPISIQNSTNNPHSQLLHKKLYSKISMLPFCVFNNSKWSFPFHKTTYLYHSITVHIYVLPEVDTLLYLYLIWTLPIPLFPIIPVPLLFLLYGFCTDSLGVLLETSRHCAHVLWLYCTYTTIRAGLLCINIWNFHVQYSYRETTLLWSEEYYVYISLVWLSSVWLDVVVVRIAFWGFQWCVLWGVLYYAGCCCCGHWT